MNIESEYTDEVICPYCGHKYSDSWEFGNGTDDDFGLIQCEYCEKEFYAWRNVEVTYSTEIANYGTCSCCKRENVVIEDSNSTLCNYKGYCVECGKKEEEKCLDKYVKKY